LLTAARIGEAQLAAPASVMGDLWRIPAEHSKNGKPHDVPLSAQAKAELAGPADRRLLFGLTTTTGGAGLASSLVREKGIEPRFTPHDLRRTAATRMSGLGILPHVIEKALNHTMQGVMGIYTAPTTWTSARPRSQPGAWNWSALRTRQRPRDYADQKNPD